MSILGIDYGSKRLGLAISGGILAKELGTLEIKTWKQAVSSLRTICQKNRVEKIILGFPMLKDKETALAKKVREFANFLSDQLELKVVLENEELTSKEARRILVSQRVPRKVINERSDSLSAKLILQQYLDEHVR